MWMSNYMYIFLESTTFVLERAKRLGASALPDKILPEVETVPSTYNNYPMLFQQRYYYCVALHSRRVFFLGNDIAVEMMMRHVFVSCVDVAWRHSATASSSSTT